MIQLKNEVGIFQGFDYRREVLKEFGNQVPNTLMDNLQANKSTYPPDKPHIAKGLLTV